MLAQAATQSMYSKGFRTGREASHGRTTVRVFIMGDMQQDGRHAEALQSERTTWSGFIALEPRQLSDRVVYARRDHPEWLPFRVTDILTRYDNVHRERTAIDDSICIRTLVQNEVVNQCTEAYSRFAHGHERVGGD